MEPKENGKKDDIKKILGRKKNEGPLLCLLLEPQTYESRKRDRTQFADFKYRLDLFGQQQHITEKKDLLDVS